jgi:hypothetical protein
VFGVSLSSAADKACCRPAASTKWYTHYKDKGKVQAGKVLTGVLFVVIIMIVAVTKNVLLCARSSFWSRQAGGTVKHGYDVDGWIMRGRNKWSIMMNLVFGRRQHDDVMKRVSVGSLYLMIQSACKL